MGTNIQRMERIRARIAARKVDGEQGSLLLDVLLGMAIFMLVAIIAVSAVGQYRERAYEQTATSDAQQLGTAVMAAATDGGSYPASADEVDDFRQSDRVSIEGYAETADGNVEFCASHADGAWATYDTGQGITDSGRDSAPGMCGGESDDGALAACYLDVEVDFWDSWDINDEPITGASAWADPQDRDAEWGGTCDDPEIHAAMGPLEDFLSTLGNADNSMGAVESTVEGMTPGELVSEIEGYLATSGLASNQYKVYEFESEF